MGKTTNPKPRLNFTLNPERKPDLDAWAEEEGRTLSNLLERIVLDALARKKLATTEKAGRSGKTTSDRKT